MDRNPLLVLTAALLGVLSIETHGRPTARPDGPRTTAFATDDGAIPDDTVLLETRAEV